ncbi:hypothetical protein ACGYQ5_14245 [Burkholderia pseudomallei]
MMPLTTDPNDPRLKRGPSDEQGQNDTYLVLSDEEIAKGFVRPLRDTYLHKTCGSTTTMGTKLAETYARDPRFYGFTFCVRCNQHFPVAEFVWDGTDQPVGS